MKTVKIAAIAALVTFFGSTAVGAPTPVHVVRGEAYGAGDAYHFRIDAIDGPVDSGTLSVERYFGSPSRVADIGCLVVTTEQSGSSTTHRVFVSGTYRDDGSPVYVRVFKTDDPYYSSVSAAASHFGSYGNCLAEGLYGSGTWSGTILP